MVIEYKLVLNQFRECYLVSLHWQALIKFRNEFNKGLYSKTTSAIFFFFTNDSFSMKTCSFAGFNVPMTVQ